MEEIRARVSERTAQKLEELAKALGSSKEELASVVLDVLAEYARDIEEVGKEIRVSDEKRLQSTMEELVFYGVEAYRLVRVILKEMGAEGCYELEELSLEPAGSLLEVELVALERCPHKADRLSIAWSPAGARIEALYYTERPERPGEVEAEWFYLPDEGALVIAMIGDKLPRLKEVDEMFDKLLGSQDHS